MSQQNGKQPGQSTLKPFFHRTTAWFDRLAGWAVARMGSATAFALALGLVVVWAATGPLFQFSETWQLVINTGTTIVTFLMVFLLQHSQNKDSRALHAKLNELLAATEGASNRLIDLEELTDEEIEHVQLRFRQLFEAAKKLRPGQKTTVGGKDIAEAERKINDAPRALTKRRRKSASKKAPR